MRFKTHKPENVHVESDELFDMIRRHEGYSGSVYLDSVGVPTGGYGHAFLVGSEIPQYIAEKFLWLDVYQASKDYDTFDFDLDPTRRGVVINMLFNLGRTRFGGFNSLIGALREKNWKKAHDEMLDSKWATQVKGRAIELAEIMLTGEYK